jgi:hypothetical protein
VIQKKKIKTVNIIFNYLDFNSKLKSKGIKKTSLKKFKKDKELISNNIGEDEEDIEKDIDIVGEDILEDDMDIDDINDNEDEEDDMDISD